MSRKLRADSSLVELALLGPRRDHPLVELVDAVYMIDPSISAVGVVIVMYRTTSEPIPQMNGQRQVCLRVGAMDEAGRRHYDAITATTWTRGDA